MVVSAAVPVAAVEAAAVLCSALPVASAAVSVLLAAAVLLFGLCSWGAQAPVAYPLVLLWLYVSSLQWHAAPASEQRLEVVECLTSEKTSLRGTQCVSECSRASNGHHSFIYIRLSNCRSPKQTLKLTHLSHSQAHALNNAHSHTQAHTHYHSLRHTSIHSNTHTHSTFIRTNSPASLPSPRP